MAIEEFIKQQPDVACAVVVDFVVDFVDIDDVYSYSYFFDYVFSSFLLFQFHVIRVRERFHDDLDHYLKVQVVIVMMVVVVIVVVVVVAVLLFVDDRKIAVI
ncbi:hypothetical protein RirG_015910 [Rhizophagus irregularis DAOM 197198w]|uniref:Transmembrane protein n=1 Tax=Rhizophagus irregularis (strain DAOM 197198w) TaxID=1432141 RepID=A0A015LF75_RHIIW|nr:hypothetical protein RirG_015910 [Rhizophagus irregularis DAOM 197198w]